MQLRNVDLYFPCLFRPRAIPNPDLTDLLRPPPLWRLGKELNVSVGKPIAQVVELEAKVDGFVFGKRPNGIEVFRKFFHRGEPADVSPLEQRFPGVGEGAEERVDE